MFGGSYDARDDDKKESSRREFKELKRRALFTGEKEKRGLNHHQSLRQMKQKRIHRHHPLNCLRTSYCRIH